MARLHYLYEQQTKGTERFVYYCIRCNCVLRARRDLGPAGEIVESLQGRCIGCGTSLEDNIECRLSPIPEDWSDVYQSGPSTTLLQKEKFPFLPASSIPHFSLGF